MPIQTQTILIGICLIITSFFLIKTGCGQSSDETHDLDVQQQQVETMDADTNTTMTPKPIKETNPTQITVNQKPPLSSYTNAPSTIHD